jgi:hypothetical protein
MTNVALKDETKTRRSETNTVLEPWAYCVGIIIILNVI